MSTGQPQASRHVPDVMSDFESWAEITARLVGLTHEQRHGVLVQFGVAQVWSQADAHWSAVMAQDLVRLDMRRISTFKSLCAAELARRDGALADPLSASTSGVMPSPAPEASEVPESRRGLHGEGADLGGGTHRLSRSELAEEVRRQQLRAQVLAWPVERYARYFALLRHRPGDADQIGREHDIADKQARAEVAHFWTKRLEADHALRRRWAVLVAQELTQLRSA